MFERIRLWRKRRKLRCPVLLRFTFPADKPDDGDLEIEVSLGWLVPGQIESKLDAWMTEMIDELDTKTTRGRRRGRSV